MIASHWTNKMTGVYEIRHLSNLQYVYFGSTTSGFKKRFKEHSNSLKRKDHINPHLQNLVDKYGIAGLLFKVLVVTNKDTIYVRRLEQEFINSHVKELGRNVVMNATLTTLTPTDDPEIKEKQRKSATINGNSKRTLIDYATTMLIQNKR